MLSHKDDLVIQSYFTIAFLGELNNQNFLNSKAYNDMVFVDDYIKSNLPSIGIGNRGTLILFLYAMLVLPKELISNRLPTEFSNLNIILNSLKNKADSTYKADNVSIDYVRHIRNAVAHAKIKFEDDLVIFEDENNKGEKCKITITLTNFGEFIANLQQIFFKFIRLLQSENPL